MVKAFHISLVLFSLFSIGCKTTKLANESKTNSSLDYKTQKNFEAVFFAAEKQKVLKNNEKALELYKQALSIDAKSHATMYQMAKLLYEKDAYPEALYLANEAVKTAGKYNHWYSGLLAQYLNKFGKYEESAEIFVSMVENEPKKRGNYIEAANQYYNAKKFDKAVAILKNMQEVFGIERESSTRLDFIYSAMGKRDLAIAEMKKLVSTYPDDVSYKGYLSETLMNADREEEAIAVLNDIIRQDSTVGKAYFALYNIHGEKRDKSSALKYLKEAVKYDDLTLRQKMQAVGTFFELMEADTEVKRSVDQMVSTISVLYPDEVETYVLLTDYYDILGNADLARKSINQALDLDQSEFAFWRRLIGLNNKTGNYLQQVSDVERALEVFPNVVNLYVTKAYAHIEQKKYTEAIEAADEGLEVATDRRDKAQLMQTKAEAYKAQENYVKSDKLYEEVLQLNPYDPSVLNNYAFNLANRKVRLEKADTMIRLALKLQPSNPYFLDTKAWILYAKGSYEEALKVLRKCIEIDPKNKEYYEHSKACYEALGNENMANDMQLKINELEENEN